VLKEVAVDVIDGAESQVTIGRNWMMGRRIHTSCNTVA
jgi:hypothetical protein